MFPGPATSLQVWQTTGSIPLQADLVKSLITKSVGIGLLAIGFVLFWIPVPLGMITMSIGALILSGDDPRLIAFIRKKRVERPRIDRGIDRLARVFPRLVSSFATATRPIPGQPGD
jgi:hypothetical protein